MFKLFFCTTTLLAGSSVFANQMNTTTQSIVSEIAFKRVAKSLGITEISTSLSLQGQTDGKNPCTVTLGKYDYGYYVSVSTKDEMISMPFIRNHTLNLHSSNHPLILSYYKIDPERDSRDVTYEISIDPLTSHHRVSLLERGEDETILFCTL